MSGAGLTMAAPQESAHARVTALLGAAGVAFTEREHAAVRTSEEAAAIRGAPLHSGAKALVLKAADRFLLAVLPADCSLDSKALRGVAGTRRIRFANRDELLELTGLTPGAVPPFGSLFGLQTICDPKLADNAQINFNGQPLPLGADGVRRLGGYRVAASRNNRQPRRFGLNRVERRRIGRDNAGWRQDA